MVPIPKETVRRLLDYADKGGSDKVRFTTKAAKIAKKRLLVSRLFQHGVTGSTEIDRGRSAEEASLTRNQ